MSYSQNKEEINKVFQINSLNNRGRFFLRTEDYEKTDFRTHDGSIAAFKLWLGAYYRTQTAELSVRPRDSFFQSAGIQGSTVRLSNPGRMPSM